MTIMQPLLFDLQDQPARAPVRIHGLESPSISRVQPARELWAAVHFAAGNVEPDGLPSETFPAALAELVRRAQAFTPRVAVESSDAVLLELAGSQRMFGGLMELLRALRGAFPRPLQLALAPTPLAAVLLARAGRNCCITSPARLAGKLAPLPFRHLHWPEDELIRLGNMGISTVGDLLRLPRAGLARRIGPQRLDELDRLAGSKPDPRVLSAPAARFSEHVEPDYETTDRDRLLAALMPTLTRLEEFLREREHGVMALRLVFQHRRSVSTATVLRCVVPEYRAARFAALLAARLEALALPEPVRCLDLAAGRLRRFHAAATSLWSAGQHGGGTAVGQSPEFLQTLMARLGEGAVHGLAQVDEHRPERQSRNVWPKLLVKGQRTVSVLSTPPAGMARPLGLLQEPQPLVAVRDTAGQTLRLLHQGQDLTLVSGPERIQSGWWDGGDVARDYYVARAADGAQWWIFRECAPPRCWFVHGCFA